MYYEYEKLLSRRLADLRTNKGISARDMSLSVGMSDSYVNKIENGKLLPKMDKFFYICDYLNVHPKDFFNEGNQNPELIDQILSEVTSLSSEQLTYLLALVKDIKR